ncbi:MAG: CBS domain-containing protein [Deltaproteobacteria bacterium]
MPTVKDLLGMKAPVVYSVRPEDTVFVCLGVLAEHDIGAVLVVGEDGRLEGIFSERDYARQVILAGRHSRDLAVSEIMTAEVVGVGPDQTINQCMAIMTAKRIRHLPVLEAGQVIGMLSIGDVVKSVIGQKQFEIEQLETYIAQG